MERRSTIDASLKILEGFSRKEMTTAIFFDIEKAYDKVNLEYREECGVHQRTDW